MMNITALLALRDGVAAKTNEDSQRAVGQLPVTPELDPASAPSAYPAKSLVLRDGRYHVAEHEK
jgi:hypothetical protein